jgi:hypothetical protein
MHGHMRPLLMPRDDGRLARLCQVARFRRSSRQACRERGPPTHWPRTPRDDETLGVHLVNRLYRRRSELVLSVGEYACWFRTLLKDIGLRPEAIDRVAPGWEVINLTSEDGGRLLLRYAKNGGAVGRGALRTLQRLKLRPVVLWPLALRHAAQEDDETTPATERSAVWAEILNSHPGQGIALDYLLQDIDSANEETGAAVHALLAHLIESGKINESSSMLIDGARQALEGNPEVLADELGYSFDDNAAWHLVLRQAAKLSSDLLNRLAGQNLNRRAKLRAIEAGLAAGALSDRTLTNLLLLDDEEVTGLLVESVAGDTDRAQRFIALMRDSGRPSAPPETEARLMAVAESAELLKLRWAATDFSITSWEALTYLTPDELAEEAREVLRTDAAALRAEVAPKLGEEHKRLADFLASEQRRSAANLLSRRQPPSDEDIDLLLDWLAKEAANGLLHAHVWRVLVRIADGGAIAKITEAIRPHVEVLGFRRSIEHLDSPLAPAIATVLVEGGADDTLQEQGRYWWIKQPERTDEELREELYAKEAIVRMTAARSLVMRLDRDELVRLQEEYPNASRPYWYNVVAFFDEHLYSPTPSD